MYVLVCLPAEEFITMHLLQSYFLYFSVVVWTFSNCSSLQHLRAVKVKWLSAVGYCDLFQQVFRILHFFRLCFTKCLSAKCQSFFDTVFTCHFHVPLLIFNAHCSVLETITFEAALYFFCILLGSTSLHILNMYCSLSQ